MKEGALRVNLVDAVQFVEDVGRMQFLCLGTFASLKDCRVGICNTGTARRRVPARRNMENA